MAWYPNADKSIKGNHAGNYTGGPAKLVLHTTEGNNGSGAISTYRTNNSWPHFQVDFDGKVWQFISTNKSARALVNASGGVETNRDSAIQIEIVGFAGQPNNHPQVQMDALKALMRWIESNTGVQPKGPGRPFATAYGQNHLRFTSQEWDNFDGICGHCHVPEGNFHWDPGAIDLESLLPITDTYLTEVIVPFTLPRNQGGYIVVGGDGGIFAYEGAPFLGSLPGISVTAKVVGAAWTQTGNGYWLLGDDGAIFSFGDSVYHGGFNTLPPTVRGNRKPIGLVAMGGGYRIVAYDPDDDTPFDGYNFGT